VPPFHLAIHLPVLVCFGSLHLAPLGWVDVSLFSPYTLLLALITFRLAGFGPLFRYTDPRRSFLLGNVVPPLLLNGTRAGCRTSPRQRLLSFSSRSPRLYPFSAFFPFHSLKVAEVRLPVPLISWSFLFNPRYSFSKTCPWPPVDVSAEILYWTTLPWKDTVKCCCSGASVLQVLSLPQSISCPFRDPFRVPRCLRC